MCLVVMQMIAILIGGIWRGMGIMYSTKFMSAELLLLPGCNAIARFCIASDDGCMLLLISVHCEVVLNTHYTYRVIDAG